MSKSGFFLSRSHIGLDSGFQAKLGESPQNWGWMDSLHMRAEGASC